MLGSCALISLSCLCQADTYWHCSASASISSFKTCRAQLYSQSVHEVLIAIYEAVTERDLGRSYAPQAHPEYQAFFLALLSEVHLGLALCPPSLRVYQPSDSQPPLSSSKFLPPQALRL
jgi:hypothetical protein